MPVGQQISVVERLLGALVRVGGHTAVGDEDLLPFIQCLLLQPGQHQVAKGFAISLGPELGRPRHRERRQLVAQADGTNEVHEQVWQQIAHLQPAAVARLQRVVVQRGHDLGRVGRRGQLGLAARSQLRIDLHGQHVVQLVGQQTPRERGFDHLPQTISRDRLQCCQHTREQ